MLGRLLRDGDKPESSKIAEAKWDKQLWARFVNDSSIIYSFLNYQDITFDIGIIWF